MNIKKFIYIWLLLGGLLISCKPVEQVRYIEVPKIEYRNVVQKEQVHDSIYITEKEFVKGDTVYIKALEYRYRDRVLRDTISIKDSITVIKEVPVQVQVKYVPPIVKWLAIAGFIAIAALIFMTLKK